MAKALLSLNVQHEYITLRTPNGNYTYSYSGSISGRLVEFPQAIKNIDNYIKTELAKKQRNLGQIMEDLTNETLMTQLWPEWNMAQAAPPAVGDMVIAPVFKKNNPGRVMEIKRKNAYVRFPGDNFNTGIAFHHLQKV
jgi:hypothetical protein